MRAQHAAPVPVCSALPHPALRPGLNCLSHWSADSVSKGLMMDYSFKGGPAACLPPASAVVLLRLPACLPARLPACLFACLLVCLPACLPASCLPALPACPAGHHLPAPAATSPRPPMVNCPSAAGMRYRLDDALNKAVYGEACTPKVGHMQIIRAPAAAGQGSSCPSRSPAGRCYKLLMLSRWCCGSRHCQRLQCAAGRDSQAAPWHPNKGALTNRRSRGGDSYWPVEGPKLRHKEDLLNLLLPCLDLCRTSWRARWLCPMPSSPCTTPWCRWVAAPTAYTALTSMQCSVLALPLLARELIACCQRVLPITGWRGTSHPTRCCV